MRQSPLTNSKYFRNGKSTHSIWLLKQNDKRHANIAAELTRTRFNENASSLMRSREQSTKSAVHVELPLRPGADDCYAIKSGCTLNDRKIASRETSRQTQRKEAVRELRPLRSARGASFEHRK